ncbi:MAG TPA: threonine synthase [Actinomycetota bacterium]|nr:threonine synthase [Actinomycetota bacterium]
MSSSSVSSLTCSRCGTAHDPSLLHNVCECGGPLLVDYDLGAVGSAVSPDEIAGRQASMWRYGELLPVADRSNVVTLGEGFTPLLPAPTLAAKLGVRAVWVKDEGLNPTGTFKARGAACGVSRARELGINEVALPTAGNAGGAWACYGSAAGLKVHVTMPSDAPEANRVECRAYGADLMLVEGLITEAARVVTEGVERDGWFDCSTLKEPYRVEGKKTLGLEIAEQLGWQAPDAIVYPAGGGVGAIGIHRAFRQLRELGWVRGGSPRLIVIQAAGCAPIVRAFENGHETSEPWADAHTIATGLNVPAPLGGALVLQAVRETGGTAVAVDDDQILEAVARMASDTSILPAPEGAATLAGASLLRERGDLDPDDRVVLINTGTGTKYPDVLKRVFG